MKKKILSVLVAMVLMLTLMPTSFATESTYDTYDSTLLALLDMTSEELTVPGIHTYAAALLLLDYVLATGNIDCLAEIAASGNGTICNYGSCVDVYYLRTDGTYLNLFYLPTSEQFTDYGISTICGSTTSGYVYMDLDMAEVATSTAELLTLLGDDDE